jgi:hypothetical protein
LDIRVCTGLNYGADITTQARICDEAKIGAITIDRGR